MALPKYYYNPKTLKYERAALSFSNILITSVGLLVAGAMFFIGMFYLQNKLITTVAEAKLREENKALKDHHALLSTRVGDSQLKLAGLLDQERELYNKFFDIRLNDDAVRPPAAMLTGDRAQFDSVVATLQNRFTYSFSRAGNTNQVFGLRARVGRSDIQAITSFPGALPVATSDPEMLVSGYGTRINPWHKAKFHHDGLDFAGTRGSDIMATGAGTVITMKNSEVQAGFGNYIEIDHGFGYVTRYAHLGEIKVKWGQRVKKGQAIAHMGISGGSIAPHVHYEVLKDGRHVDPLKVLVEGIGSNQYHLLATAANQPNQSLD